MSTEPTLSFTARYARQENSLAVPAREVQLVLGTDSLGIKFVQGEAQSYPLREVVDLVAGDYCLRLATEDGSEIILSHLGRDYENFRREMAARRNALLLSDLLMEEPLVIGGLHGVCEYQNGAQRQVFDPTEVRLYQTALVIIPEIGTLRRVPFSDIAEITAPDFQLVVRTEYGDTFILSRLGRDLAPLKHHLDDLRHELMLKAQNLVKELLPSAGTTTVFQLAALMKEGRAVRRRELEALGATLWTELEQHLTDSEAAEEYAFLKTLGRAQDISIGFKRGLKEGENDYLWFLVPIGSLDARRPGNAAVMEAVSPDGESRATYAFRLVDRREYPLLKTEEALQAAVDGFLRNTNRALLAINFRREPIYLSREALLRPQYARYRYAVAALPELRALRRSFIGRIAHLSPEQWQADIMSLLAFNTAVGDNEAVWSRSGLKNC